MYGLTGTQAARLGAAISGQRKSPRRRKPATQTALAARYQRAVEGLAKGEYTVSELRPGLYQVEKTDSTAYKVRFGAGMPVCTCPDWQRHGHGHVCKHVLMASMAAQPVVYVGFRTAEGPRVHVVRDGNPFLLRHVEMHSPTGFEWGYAGSGPADLALSILADYLGNEEAAESLKGVFKEEVVSRLPSTAWMLTEDALAAFFHRHPVRLPVNIPAYA